MLVLRIEIESSAKPFLWLFKKNYIYWGWRDVVLPENPCSIPVPGELIAFFCPLQELQACSMQMYPYSKHPHT